MVFRLNGQQLQKSHDDRHNHRGFVCALYGSIRDYDSCQDGVGL